MRMSVSRRLALLAAVEIATAAVLAIVALISLQHVASNVAFTRRYGLPPIEALGTSLVENGHMLDMTQRQSESGKGLDRAMLEEHLRTLRAVEARYRSDWLMKDNPSTDARRARAALDSLGQRQLVEEEKTALDELSDALRRLERATDSRPSATADALRDIQVALRELRNVSVAYLAHWQTAIEREADATRRDILGVAAAGIVMAGWAALRVRIAIAPRIRELVHKVQRFRELGVHDRSLDAGRDEIAVLANAIDAGFTAIAERDRERERFLAIAAHELRTPLSSILGFAQAASMRPEDCEVTRRALAVIERHGCRLARLLEDVLLVARSRSGDLSVHRAPTDLVSALRKVLAEVEASGQIRVFSIDAPTSAPILADAVLLGHALWTLLTYAVVISSPAQRLEIRIVSEPARSEIRVHVRGRDMPQEEFERALAPFGSLVFEGVGGVRTGVGLYLCREIARHHGGGLRMEGTATGLVLVLELPS